MDVEQRLAQIERKQDRNYIILEQLTEKLETVAVNSNERHQRVERTLWGVNGSAASSLLVRLDRLEQSHRMQSWVVRVAASVVIVGVVGGLWTLLAG